MPREAYADDADGTDGKPPFPVIRGAENTIHQWKPFSSSGGARFIGSHTCKAMAAEGFVPVAFDQAAMPISCARARSPVRCRRALTFSRTISPARRAHPYPRLSRTHPETAGYGEQPARLVWAHHLRNLVRLADVIDLGREVEPPRRHAEQKPHCGHNPVAVTDAHPCLGQVQLKKTDVLACRGLR